MERVFVTGGSGFIGTNLLERLSEDQIEVANYDIKVSRSRRFDRISTLGDILDGDKLSAIIADFRPDCVVHLAARCDLDGQTIEDYRANTDGLRNVIAAIASAPSVKRTIFASSRYVHGNEIQPERDNDYSPFTMYGASKAEGEMIVRSSHLESSWLIVRPTSIWGPWFGVPYRGFFDAVRKGVYIHPAAERLYKSYGYVGNVVHQIRRMIEAPVDSVQGRTFYTADYQPIEIRSMAECIRHEFGAPKVSEAPLALLKLLATGGDVLKRCGWKNAPLSTFRLNNLRCQMVYDLSKTEEVVGDLPYSMEDGVARTVEWMRRVQ